MFNLTLTSKVLGRSLKTSLTAGLVALSMVSGAQAADKTIKIGVVYDYTGALAGASSVQPLLV